MIRFTAIAIDDDPFFLRLLEKQLAEFPNIDLIITAENPVKGAVQIVKYKPDILFLDLEMPYIDGFETIEMLEQRPKIIVISAHDSYADQVKEMDPDAFLSKPVDQEKLAAAIQKVTS